MILRLPVGFLMTRCAEGDQIFGSIIAQSAPWLNVMDLKILHPPARLTTPAISLEDFPAELAISFGIKSQAGRFVRIPVKGWPAPFQGAAPAAPAEGQLPTE